MSLYLRELESEAGEGRETTNSRQLGEALGLTDAQVRKDLACFGQFGQPGVGYRVKELVSELRKIFGTDGLWGAVIVGAGNIGRAVMSYHRLRRRGFDIAAVFDSDPALIGTEIDGHHVRPMHELTEISRARQARIGMLAVPADSAQNVADALIAAGVQGILNFAPVRLRVDDSVAIVNVDLSISLEQLAFKISLGHTAQVELPET